MNPNAFFIVISFVVVLGVFLITLLSVLRKKQNPTLKSQKKTIDFQTVMLLLESKYSTIKDIERASRYFFDNYTKWNLNKSQKQNFLFVLCLHQNTTSKMILQAQEQLSKLNPDMKKDFERIVKKAIDLR
ncbi:hypothetical protein [Helicobacter cappadocius]|uniref:Uncharacterized protein n=1 Tax=Helicobacter cappadocius TaxID=3063998 RepID=A0AA90PJ20_9HELI|nr:MULTISPECIES: hypothetical protein [unclassified Helicobacter]MDO7252618.1 hypothetical protein [Helicobacter sp. faydin-H75]MDP2538485.1 hypothetical protein [Helicobacter sp. faydin-H76]